MQNILTAQQALIKLAEAASQAKLSYEEHLIVKKSIEVLAAIISPKDEVKTEEVIKEPLNTQ
jgi:hypothetical protein